MSQILISLVLVLLSGSWLPAASGSQAKSSPESGRYCYALETDTLTAAARLDIYDGGTVYGTLDGVVHDEANAYYTSYTRDFSGTLAGEKAELQITTWIEYDVQDDTETWTITADRLVTPGEQLAAADCEPLETALAEMGGGESWTVEDEPGYPVHYRRVAIDPGYSTVTYRSGVVRGERDVYVLRGREGQAVTLWIDAVEDNAVFDVFAPDGEFMAAEQRDALLHLPMNGTYEIWVGGTRGNASYELVIAVR